MTEKKKIDYQPYKIFADKIKGKVKEFTEDEIKELFNDLNNLPPQKATIVFGLIYQHHKLNKPPEGQVFGKKGKGKSKKIEYPYSPDVSGKGKCKDLTYTNSNLPGELLTIAYEYVQLDKDITSEINRGEIGNLAGKSVSFVGSVGKKAVSD
jgi:hypothetical protein